MSEVLRDLVVSLSLDGDNFSRNLTSINKQIQEAESEFKRAASGVDGFEKSVAGAQSKLTSLQQKLTLQQRAVSQYRKALEAANKKLENCNTRQGKLTESLEKARQKNANLKKQVGEATKQYERFSRELGESDSATIAAKANMDALTQEYAESSTEVKKLEGQLATNTKSLRNNAEALPDEVLKIATDLDMTGAQARWNEFAQNPGAITTEAIVTGFTQQEGVEPPSWKRRFLSRDMISLHTGNSLPITLWKSKVSCGWAKCTRIPKPLYPMKT